VGGTVVVVGAALVVVVTLALVVVVTFALVVVVTFALVVVVVAAGLAVAAPRCDDLRSDVRWARTGETGAGLGVGVGEKLTGR
jgi:hypothetical protein